MRVGLPIVLRVTGTVQRRWVYGAWTQVLIADKPDAQGLSCWVPNKDAIPVDIGQPAVVEGTFEIDASKRNVPPGMPLPMPYHLTPVLRPCSVTSANEKG
jgi:hypothetical protein